GFEQLAEIQTPRIDEQGGVHGEAGRAVVTDFIACKVVAKTRGRAEVAVGVFQLQQRTRPPAVGRAPPAGGKFRTTDDIRREDRETAAAADVFLFAERGVEVHCLVEGKIIDVDQVIPWPAAAYAEVRELAGGCQAGQAVQREEGVRATADGASQRFPVEIGAVG